MAKDWKESLSALRGTLEEPKEEEKEVPSELTEDNKFNSQKTSLYIVVDKKGRNGKVATIIEGFTISKEEVEKIARQLKQNLGVGGSVREGEILIQGDHKEAIKKFLCKLNFKIKG